MLFRFHIFAIGLVLVARPYILTNEALCSSCWWKCEKLLGQREHKSSRIAWAVMTASCPKVNLTTSIRRSGLSVPRFFCVEFCLLGTGGQGKRY